MKEFIEYLVKQIIKKPEDVAIEEQNSDMGIQIIIKVADEDMGIIIGKEGRTIKSIRALAKAKAIIDNIRVNVELLDPKNLNAKV